MVFVEELGEAVRLGGYEVPDLTQELSAENRRWYMVMLGAGTFAVRASSEVFALSKTVLQAHELRNSRNPIETNGGFPLVTPMIASDDAFYTAAMYPGKRETQLIALQEEGRGLAETTKSMTSIRPYDNNQGHLFDPFKI